MGATELPINGVIQKTATIIQRQQSYSDPRQAYSSGYKHSRVRKQYIRRNRQAKTCPKSCFRICNKEQETS